MIEEGLRRIVREEVRAALADEKRRASIGLAPVLLSRREAAEYLGISVRLFDDLGIARVVISDRAVRFRREDLDRFAAERLECTR